MLEKTIKNLVFEGGGVKGIAYSGALNVLAEKNILDEIEKVAGTSAGAITAALVALRYSAAEIEKIIFDMDFNSFEDDKNYRRVKSEYGLYAGDVFLDWMTDLIKKKKLDAKATFDDLHKNGCLDLKIYATDLYIQDIQEFSYANTPNVIVAEAVRASMAIPLFFKAWKFSNSIPNDHIYVDGGVLLNYPIYAFDKNDTPNNQTLGIQLENLGQTATSNAFGYNNLKEYTKVLFETLMLTQKIALAQDATALKRTVSINDLGISSTNFDLTKEEKNNLIVQGRKAMETYFDVKIVV